MDTHSVMSFLVETGRVRWLGEMAAPCQHYQHLTGIWPNDVPKSTASQQTANTLVFPPHSDSGLIGLAHEGPLTCLHRMSLGFAVHARPEQLGREAFIDEAYVS